MTARFGPLHAKADEYVAAASDFLKKEAPELDWTTEQILAYATLLAVVDGNQG